MLVDDVWKKIDWFCCLIPVLKIYNRYFLWTHYAKILFLWVWLLFLIDVSRNGDLKLCDSKKALGASITGKPMWNCDTQVKSYKLSHILYEMKMGHLQWYFRDINPYHKDHLSTVPAAAALEDLYSGSVLRSLGKNIHVLVP